VKEEAADAINDTSAADAIIEGLEQPSYWKK